MLSKFSLAVLLCCINFSVMVLVLYMFEEHIGLSSDDSGDVHQCDNDRDGDNSCEEGDGEGVRQGSPWWKYLLLVFLPPFLMLPTIVCSLKYAGCIAKKWSVSVVRTDR